MNYAMSSVDRILCMLKPILCSLKSPHVHMTLPIVYCMAIRLGRDDRMYTVHDVLVSI